MDALVADRGTPGNPFWAYKQPNWDWTTCFEGLGWWVH